MATSSRSSRDHQDGLAGKHLTDSQVAASQEEDEKQDSSDSIDQVPEGGFLAWLQVAAAFFIFMNTAGLFNSYGIYQSFYAQGPLSTTSGSDIAWIGSLQGCLMMLLCIGTGPLYDLGYLRSLVNIGTFTIVFGMMMASLCKSYWQYILAQGLVIGIGNGLLFLPSIAIVPQYFAKRKAFATGIVAIGSSIGSLIFPIIFIRLSPTIGFRWATRIIGFTMLATSSITVFGIKARTQPPPLKRKIYDLESFRDSPFVYFCISMCLGFMGVYVLFFYVEVYAAEQCHMSKQLAPYTIPLANAGALLGRMITNPLADKVGPLNLYIPATFISGMLAICWIPVRSPAGIIVFSIIYGFFSAPFVSLMGLIVVEISTHTPKLIGTRMGMAFTFAGLGLLIGSPIAGAILTKYGWVGVQTFAGSLVVASGCSLVGVWGAKYGWVVKTRA